MVEEQEKKSRWARFRESSRNRYRLVIMKDETFDEVGSYKLSPLNLYIAISTVLVLLAILMFFLIAYTPLRRMIPGYGDVVSRSEMLDMQRTVIQLSEQLEAQELQTQALYRTAFGDYKPAEIDSSTLDMSNEELPEQITVSAEEMQLRQEVQQRQSGAYFGSGRPVRTVTENTNTDVRLEGLPLITPINGEISAGFNPTEGHFGLDILAPANTAIKACLDGVVFQSEYTSAYGFVIGIQHSNNIISFYKHNSSLLKEVGSRVTAGEAIAIIGNTGTQSTGPHLHFELWQNGQVIDPGEYLTF
ncbi:MAG: M23 family metallopeptidase [Bacteroidota bacterium]